MFPLPKRSPFIPALRSCVISVSGFTAETQPTREELKSAIDAVGACYLGSLCKDVTTHLLCGGGDSDKLRAARSWRGRVWLLRAEWLLACLREWRRVDESAYRLDDDSGMASVPQDDVSTADDNSEAMGDEEQIIVDNLFLSESSPCLLRGGVSRGDGVSRDALREDDVSCNESRDALHEESRDSLTGLSHRSSNAPSNGIPAIAPLQDGCVPASQESDDDSSPSQSLSTPSKRCIHSLSQSPFPTPSKRPAPPLSFSPSPDKRSRPLFDAAKGAGDATRMSEHAMKGAENATEKPHNATENIDNTTPDNTTTTKPTKPTKPTKSTKSTKSTTTTKPTTTTTTTKSTTQPIFLLSSEIPASTAVDTIRQLGGQCVQTHE